MVMKANVGQYSKRVLCAAVVQGARAACVTSRMRASAESQGFTGGNYE